MIDTFMGVYIVTKIWSICKALIFLKLFFVRDCICQHKNEKGGHFQFPYFGVLQKPPKADGTLVKSPLVFKMFEYTAKAQTS